MLILNIIDNTNLLENKIENYFIILSYCKKYNINFNYNKIDNTNNIISNIDLTNLHQHLLNLNINQNLLNLNINSYIINILSYYISDADIIKEFYNFNNDIQLFNKYNIFAFDYVCIHINYGDIINDTKKYLSINYFIDKYNKLDELYKLLKLIIISNEDNINNYFNNYILISNNNDNDKLNIMIYAKYLITSNNKLDYYAKLLNKNNFI